MNYVPKDVYFRFQRVLPVSACTSGFSTYFRFQRLLPVSACTSRFSAYFRFQHVLPVSASTSGFSVYLVARARPRGVLGWGYFIVLFPFRFVYSTLSDILSFVCEFTCVVL